MKMTDNNFLQRSFTLIELMVVISIIGMLSSVVLSATQNARERGRVESIITFDTYNYHKLGASMIASWDFNEGSGTIAKDSSSNAYNLTLKNSAQFDNFFTPKNSGYSLKLPVQNSHARFDFTSPLLVNSQLSNSISLSLWTRASSAIGSRYIYYMLDPIAYTRVINVLCRNKDLYVYSGRSDYVVKSNSPVCTDNKWHNITISYTVGSSKNLSVYFDGQYYMKSSLPNGGGGASIKYIFVGAPALSFIGNIDDVRIYGDSLTAMDVEHIYAEGLPAHEFAISQK